MYPRLLSILAFALVVPTMAATTNGVTFSVRQENGVDQNYQLEVPPNLPPAKPDPTGTTGKISRMKRRSWQSDGLRGWKLPLAV